jgi:hypothetical protein
MASRKHAITGIFLVRRFISPVCRDIDAVDLVWDFFPTPARAP